MPFTNGVISGPYTNIWVDKTEVSDVSSLHNIRVVHDNICKATYLAGLKYLVVQQLSCNTPYSSDTLRDIKSFNTNLPRIFKSLTSSSSNLFKDTENLFHFLMLSFSFSFLFDAGTF